MDFWKKLKKEKLLLSVMTMAIVDLLIFAIFIVFPLMDYNFKSKEAVQSDTENLASNTESELEDEITVTEADNSFDGPISDKYNSQGIEGYNTNKGNGGEAAKDTTPVSTEDEDDILIDEDLTTTKVSTTEELASEEDNSENSSEELSTEDSSSNATEEVTTEETTEETITDVPQTSTNYSEQISTSEEMQ